MKSLSQLFGASLVLALGGLVSTAGAAAISLNFSENNANQIFAGGQSIGPLTTNSTNWNSTTEVNSAASGTINDLEDSAGATLVGTSVAWASAITWYNDDSAHQDDDHDLSVGYLDDGGAGVSVTFSNIPYASYRVYGLLASDQGGGPNYTTHDFTVNGQSVFGAATAPAYNAIEDSNTATSSYWSLADGTTRGNYWAIDATGSTLTITAPPRAGSTRGSLTGVIIHAVPEPSSLAIAACGVIVAAGAVRRRK